jgi:hypothetical protein
MEITVLYSDLWGVLWDLYGTTLGFIGIYRIYEDLYGDYYRITTSRLGEEIY